MYKKNFGFGWAICWQCSQTNYLFKIGARLGTGLPSHDRSKQNMEPPLKLSNDALLAGDSVIC